VIHPWNEPILDALARRLERLPHALLIHGPRGVGKRVLAERISQLLLCEGEKRPCDTCDACRWFRGGNHPDFRRVEPEFLWAEKPDKPSLVIKVEQVRELAEFLYIGSHRGRLRVALVHPAEEMNENAANALLKGLEEPPAGAIFILVSHCPAQLLPTIRSRCVAVPVPLPPHNIALDWLAREGVTEPQRWLAYAGGAPLRATQYAAQGPVSLTPVGERDGLEPLADALQKIALDRALMAFGLAAKYQTSPATVTREQARAWLAFARRMGEERLLCRHPLNPRLFSAALLTRMPDLT
jgi:DNA polymerase-3 subunit delta'